MHGYVVVFITFYSSAQLAGVLMSDIAWLTWVPVGDNTTDPVRVLGCSVCHRRTGMSSFRHQPFYYRKNVPTRIRINESQKMDAVVYQVVVSLSDDFFVLVVADPERRVEGDGTVA